MKEQIKNIAIRDLHPFPDNPFSVREDTELQDSIRDYGVISPLVVRPIDSGGYEIISGHRRKAACEAAGITTVPAFVRELDDTAAVIALVDSNLHREHVLPSEKAHAYKLKLGAIKKQGRRADLSPDSTCGQAVHKSRDEIAESESGRQVQRYIRLCELIPPILAMVDEGKIALSPAVELSYLTPQQQTDLLATMESEDRTPSHAQAIRMHRLSADGQLDMDEIFKLMTEEKPTRKSKSS
ncbi:MAG: ParB/RepB/Spo0J family partition protein [Oscillospiraceae bacterium]|jgi:ParB family chromosome partitioning protein|nr:ParB/RepB/Spo0J family partition protein [Oscillospiraceae bacterium]